MEPLQPHSSLEAAGASHELNPTHGGLRRPVTPSQVQHSQEPAANKGPPASTPPGSAISRVNDTLRAIFRPPNTWGNPRADDTSHPYTSSAAIEATDPFDLAHGGLLRPTTQSQQQHERFKESIASAGRSKQQFFGAGLPFGEKGSFSDIYGVPGRRSSNAPDPHRTSSQSRDEALPRLESSWKRRELYYTEDGSGWQQSRAARYNDLARNQQRRREFAENPDAGQDQPYQSSQATRSSQLLSDDPFHGLPASHSLSAPDHRRTPQHAQPLSGAQSSQGSGSRADRQLRSNTTIPSRDLQAHTTSPQLFHTLPVCPYPPLPRVVAAYYRAQAQASQPSPPAHPASDTAARVPMFTEEQMKKGVRPAAPLVRHQLNTIADVLAYKASRKLEWQPPTNDPSFPKTEAQCKFYVDRLLAAMTDVEVARDSTGSNASFMTRWLLKMSKGIYHCMDDSMALVCWDLVDIAMTLQLYGPGALNIYEPDLIKEIQATSDTRFNARITAMCKVMTASKARCITLMQGETVETFVAGIVKKEKAQKMNAENNPRRSHKTAEYNKLTGKTTTKGKKGRAKTVPAADPSAAAADGSSTGLAEEKNHAETRVNATRKNGVTTAAGSSSTESTRTVAPVATVGNSYADNISEVEDGIIRPNMQLVNGLPSAQAAATTFHYTSTGFGSQHPTSDLFIADSQGDFGETTPAAGQSFETEYEATGAYRMELEQTQIDQTMFDLETLTPQFDVAEFADQVVEEEDLAYFVSFDTVNPISTDTNIQGAMDEDNAANDNEAAASTLFQSYLPTALSENRQCFDSLDVKIDFTPFINEAETVWDEAEDEMYPATSPRPGSFVEEATGVDDGSPPVTAKRVCRGQDHDFYQQETQQQPLHQTVNAILRGHTHIASPSIKRKGGSRG